MLKAEHPSELAFIKSQETKEYRDAEDALQSNPLFSMRILFSLGWNAALLWVPFRIRTLTDQLTERDNKIAELERKLCARIQESGGPDADRRTDSTG